MFLLNDLVIEQEEVLALEKDGSVCWYRGKCAGWWQEATVLMDAFDFKLRIKRLFSSCFLGLI